MWSCSEHGVSQSSKNIFHLTNLETGAPVEPLAALLTDVGLDTGVLHGVELQLTPIMKGGVTVFTGELLAQLRIVDVELVFLSQLERGNVVRGEILFIIVS